MLSTNRPPTHPGETFLKEFLEPQGERGPLARHEGSREQTEGPPLAQDRVRLDAAKTLGVRTVLLDRSTDVDDAADLSRFLNDPADSTGRRTRACVLKHLAHRPIASQQSR